MTTGEEQGWPQWRGTVSQETEDQIDVLSGAGLQDGERLAKKYGEFYPFAIVWKKTSDEPETIMVADDLEEEFPDSAQLLERLWQVVTEQRDELWGVAVVSDIFADGQSAVSVAVEHREGVFFTLLHLYRLKKFGKGGKLIGLSGMLSEARVWA